MSIYLHKVFGWYYNYVCAKKLIIAVTVITCRLFILYTQNMYICCITQL